MKKSSRLLAVLVIAIIIIGALSLTASADIGPKASVRIQFENMGGELCYGTLLSKYESTGPQSVWDGNEEHIYNYDLDIDIWRAFAQYEDSDGYYYLQNGWKVSETGEIAWTYYPPSSFKILLYYPETETFAVSDIYERYAFDTYYTVDMSGFDIKSVDYNEELSTDARIKAYRAYNFWNEFGTFAVRVVITVIIELVIALAFGMKKKGQLLLLLGANVLTQLVLNLMLNLAAHTSDILLILLYFVLEVIVFALEALLYCKLMGRWAEEKKPNWYYILYALIANGVSFGAGLILADYLPTIF